MFFFSYQSKLKQCLARYQKACRKTKKKWEPFYANIIITPKKIKKLRKY